ncbi:MAG TPA: SHOCT domain-containing protein [Candidatus Paceibacterota bacterium]
MMYWDGYGYGMGPLGAILSFIFFILVIVLIAYGVRYIVRETRTHERRGGEDALEILKGRYARGEIDTREFEERRKALTEK